MEKLLTAEEAAEILNLSKSMVYLLSSTGRLRRVKIGNALRFRREDLVSFVERHTEEEREPVTA